MKKPTKKPVKTTAKKPAKAAAARPVRMAIQPFSFKGTEYQLPALDIAEQNATKAHFEARLGKWLGVVKGSENEQEKAEWWQALRGAENARDCYDEWQDAALSKIDALLVRAETADGEELGEKLGLLLRRLTEGIHALAAHGRPWAARLLLDSLYQATDSFNFLADAKPELFDFVKERDAIPGLITSNPEKTKDNTRLVRSLKVASGGDYGKKRGKNWLIKEKSMILASLLVSYIEEKRPLFLTFDIQEQTAGRETATWIKKAMKLAPFSPPTHRAWAEVGWEIVKHHSEDGDPVKNPYFNDPKTWGHVKRRKKNDHGKIIASPSIARSDIKETLFKGFDSYSMQAGLFGRTEKTPKSD